MNEPAPSSASSPSRLRSSEFVLCLLGPLSFTVASSLLLLGFPIVLAWFVWPVVWGGLLAQPAFVLGWCVQGLVNPRWPRYLTFWLLTLHLVCLFLMWLLWESPVWFEGVLCGQWVLGVVTGVVCLRQRLHPPAAMERTPPR